MRHDACPRTATAYPVAAHADSRLLEDATEVLRLRAVSSLRRVSRQAGPSDVQPRATDLQRMRGLSTVAKLPHVAMPPVATIAAASR